MGHVTDQPTTSTEWAQEILVKHYRGGHLIEQRHCDDPRAAAGIVESWEARPTPDGERIVVEPHPPEAIVALLRAIANAIEQERPLAMAQPFPHLRLELVTEGPEQRDSRRGELKLLWQELGHPGG
jgi:hypothetical protein